MGTATCGSTGVKGIMTSRSSTAPVCWSRRRGLTRIRKGWRICWVFLPVVTLSERPPKRTTVRCQESRHADFIAATGIPIYLCDAHSPWQCGSNENTNGLLRQYPPKGSDLSVIRLYELNAIQDSLNGRPRKTLGHSLRTDATRRGRGPNLRAYRCLRRRLRSAK